MAFLLSLGDYSLSKATAMSRLFSKGALRHSTNAAISTHVPPGPLRTTTPTSKAAARVLRALASRDRPISSPASRRDIHHVGRFEPLRPPSPSSLGAPRAARTYVRGRRWGRRLLLLSAVLGAAYLTDRAVYASGLARTLRTLGTGLVVALDYKLNFRPDPLPWLGGAAGIPELHRRNAERLFALLHHNGGLYLKIGQAIAMQSAVLPPEFARMFARMFDDAPQDGWDKIERVIREDFDGRSVQEVFGVRFADSEGKADAEGTGVMETTARASASVAQVHYGKLPDGREIAVKIQKPDIAKQINWDLWAFKYVLHSSW